MSEMHRGSGWPDIRVFGSGDIVELVQEHIEMGKPNCRRIVWHLGVKVAVCGLEHHELLHDNKLAVGNYLKKLRSSFVYDGKWEGNEEYKESSVCLVCGRRHLGRCLMCSTCGHLHPSHPCRQQREQPDNLSAASASVSTSARPVQARYTAQHTAVKTPPVDTTQGSVDEFVISPVFDIGFDRAQSMVKDVFAQLLASGDSMVKTHRPSTGDKRRRSNEASPSRSPRPRKRIPAAQGTTSRLDLSFYMR